jgi:ATP-binding protein involved in chromosome partitioning
MITRENILATLERVIHPEKGAGIVTLGILTDVVIADSGISLLLEPEKSNDPFISSIKSVIVKILKEEYGADIVIKNIEVKPKVIVGKKHQEKQAGIFGGIKNIIAVSSGKGGVGKSTVAVNLSVALARLGYTTGLLDADIFGPSVPRMFNAEKYQPEVIRSAGTDMIVPLVKYGVKVLSAGFFVDPAEAVVWRGPMASGFLKQLMQQGDWGELDFLVVDLPPGTSDIHLTLVQESAVTGAIVVTTPQEVALADAVKGIAMFRSEKISVPVLGLVENMAWFTPAELPENKYYIFGRDGGRKLAEESDVPLLGQIPLVQSICEGGDSGEPVVLGDTAAGTAFMNLASSVVERVIARNRESRPTQKVQMNS